MQISFQAIEKFAGNVMRITHSLTDFIVQLQETELPNDVSATQAVIKDHDVEKIEVLEDLASAMEHGRILLECLQTPLEEDEDKIAELDDKDGICLLYTSPSPRD